MSVYSMIQSVRLPSLLRMAHNQIAEKDNQEDCIVLIFKTKSTCPLRKLTYKIRVFTEIRTHTSNQKHRTEAFSLFYVS